MRITREMLLKITEDTVAERTKSDPAIIAACLVGSVWDGEPVLGGAADIDLTFVYSTVSQYREIVRLTEDVHLDILHHEKKRYEPARELRSDPWIGTTIYACKPLYDPEHFLDFTQASVRGLFNQPENIYARAVPLLETARNIWVSFQTNPPKSDPDRAWNYLDSLEHAANAIACLSGPPLTERRLLLNFSTSAENVGRPGLFQGLLGLVGGIDLDPEVIRGWLPDWEEAYDLAWDSSHPPVHLHRYRRAYHRRGVEGLLETEQPQAALWPLLRTWTMAAQQLPPDATPLRTWRAACEQLNLTGEGFEERLAGLDAYLDTANEVIENWHQGGEEV
ncbi:MAG: hypothetical protein PVF83_03675 [Anaerolineales bacterium]